MPKRDDYESESLKDRRHGVETTKHTKFHDPKNRDPNQLEPNTAGEGVGSNQVDEDSTVNRKQGGVSEPGGMDTYACIGGLTGGKSTQDQMPLRISGRQRFVLCVTYVEESNRRDVSAAKVILW